MDTMFSIRVASDGNELFRLCVNDQYREFKDSWELYVTLIETLNKVADDTPFMFFFRWNTFSKKDMFEIVRILSTKKIVILSVYCISQKSIKSFYKLLSNPHIQEITLEFQNVKGMFRDDIKFITGVLNRLNIITGYFDSQTTFFNDFSFMEKFNCIECLYLSNLQITKKGFESLVKTIQKLKIQDVELHSLELSKDIDSRIYYELFKTPFKTISLMSWNDIPDNFFENMFLGISNQIRIEEVTVTRRDLQNESNILNHLHLIKSHVSLRHLGFHCNNDEFSKKIRNYTDKIMRRLNSKESQILVALCSPFFISRLRSSIPQHFPIPLFRILDEMLGRA